MMMNLNIAKHISKAAIQKAREMNILCSVAVVDRKGFLVALYRMDGTPVPTADMARDKAWTAAAFRAPSSEVDKYGDPSKQGGGFSAQNWNDRLTTIPGGLPLIIDDRVVGGIGVSGGTPEEDVEICREAIKSIYNQY